MPDPKEESQDVEPMQPDAPVEKPDEAPEEPVARQGDTA